MSQRNILSFSLLRTTLLGNQIESPMSYRYMTSTFTEIGDKTVYKRFEIRNWSIWSLQTVKESKWSIKDKSTSVNLSLINLYIKSLTTSVKRGLEEIIREFYSKPLFCPVVLHYLSCLLIINPRTNVNKETKKKRKTQRVWLIVERFWVEKVRYFVPIIIDVMKEFHINTLIFL